MLYNGKHKSDIQYHNDCNDRIAVIKTLFEWCYVVLVAIIISIFIFSFIFRISEIFIINSDNKKIPVSILISSYGYYPCAGDNVAVSTENGICTATVLAKEKQNIITYTESSQIALDYVLVDSEAYPNVEEFEKIYGGRITVPDGCVLVIYDDFCAEKSCSTEIVNLNNIVGKVNSVLYPIEYFGKEISVLSRGD